MPENKPVKSVSVYAQNDMKAMRRTHEDPMSIFLPALDHLVVRFLCGFGVHGEGWSRVVTERNDGRFGVD